MIVLALIVLRLLADLAGLVLLSLRRRRSVEAENLFLRRELALYQERGVEPRRVDATTRVSLAVLSRLFDWREALVVVRPETLIRWHRAGWRLVWRVKSRPGRPRIPLELRRLIRRMATENPIWGEERIANELLLMLGLRVSPRTVRKYMPKRPPGRPRGDQRWATFLRNHAGAIVAVSRRAGPSTGGRPACDTTNPPSDRRAPRRARQIGAGRFASRISAGARVGVIGQLRRTGAGLLGKVIVDRCDAGRCGDGWVHVPLFK